MKKLITLLFMLLGIFMMLTGCQKEKAETEVLEDIESLFVSDHSNLVFDEVRVELVKRQTDMEAKIDSVWAVISADNSDVSLRRECELTYILYNEGWELEEYSYPDTSYRLKRSTITEQDALKQIESQGKKYESMELADRITDLENGLDTFVYHGRNKDGYVTLVDEIKVEYEYVRYNGWKHDGISVEEISREWSVLGKWTYRKNDDDMWIIIHDINNGKITVEYDFDYNCEGISVLDGEKMSTERYTSNGKVTRDVVNHKDGFRFHLLEGQMSLLTMFVSREEGITFSGIWFDDQDSYVFEYVGK